MCSLEETLKYVEPGESFPILGTIDLRELGEELALKPVMASHYVKLLVRLGVLEEVDRLRPGGKPVSNGLVEVGLVARVTPKRSGSSRTGRSLRIDSGRY